MTWYPGRAEIMISKEWVRSPINPGLPLQASLPTSLFYSEWGIPGEPGFIPVTAGSQGNAPRTLRLPWPCP